MSNFDDFGRDFNDPLFMEVIEEDEKEFSKPSKGGNSFSDSFFGAFFYVVLIFLAVIAGIFLLIFLTGVR